MQAGWVSIEATVDEPISFGEITTNVPPPGNARRRAIWLVLLLTSLLTIFIVLSYRLRWSWTGFVGDADGARSSAQVTEGPSYKHLWDWLDLLFVPAILALGAWYLNRAETNRRMAEEAQTALREQAAVARRDYRDVVNLYVTVMTQLLLEHGLRSSPPEAEVRTIARTRTLLALTSVGGAHKGEIVELLARGGLILGPDPIVDLRGADLSLAELVAFDLRGVNLSGSDLSGARLDASDLTGAFLRGANLGAKYQPPDSAVGTSLVDAALRGADLTGAKIGDYLIVDAATSERVHGHGTDLSGADLTDADISAVDLLHYRVVVTGTSSLRGGGDFFGPRFVNTNLQGARVAHDVEQLRASKAFSGAAL